MKDDNFKAPMVYILFSLLKYKIYIFMIINYRIFIVIQAIRSFEDYE